MPLIEPEAAEALECEIVAEDAEGVGGSAAIIVDDDEAVMDEEPLPIPILSPTERRRVRRNLSRRLPATRGSLDSILVIDSLKKYQQEVSKYGLLTPIEEYELARSYKEDGDERALETLVVCNLRLVMSIAKKYMHRGMEHIDLIQEGNFGLIKGLKKFDYTKGFRVSTYVTWWIKQCISRSIAEQGRTIRVPVHINEKLMKINRRTGDFYRKWHRMPTPEELSEFFDDHERLSPADIVMVLEAARPIDSIDKTYSEDSDTSVSESVADETILDPVHAIAQENLVLLFDELIRKLPDRERYIVEKRAERDGNKGYTLDHLGKQLAVTRERVRQLQDKAYGTLRADCIERGVHYSDHMGS